MFVIEKVTGNIGVGTFDPKGRFHIANHGNDLLVVTGNKVGIGGEPSVARFEVIDNNNTIFSINNDKIGIKTNVPSADVDYVLSNNLFTNTALRIKNLTGPILEVRNNGNLGIGTEPTLNYGIIIDKTTLLNDGLTIKQSPLVVSANQYRWDLDGGIHIEKVEFNTPNNYWNENGDIYTSGTLVVTANANHTINGTLNLTNLNVSNILSDINASTQEFSVSTLNTKVIKNTVGTDINIENNVIIKNDVIVGSPAIQFGNATKSDLYVDGNIIIEGRIYQNQQNVNVMSDLYVSNNANIANTLTSAAIIGTANAFAKLSLVSTSNSNQDTAFEVRNQNNSTLLKIANDGKVGINTSNVLTNELTVDGSVHIAENLILNGLFNGIKIDTGVVTANQLNIDSGKLYLSNNTANGDQFIYFYNNNMQGEYFKWKYDIQPGNQRFELSDNLDINGSLSVKGQDIFLSNNGAAGDQSIYFYDTTINDQYIKWVRNGKYFDISSSVTVNGTVTATINNTINGLSITNGSITDAENIEVLSTLNIKNKFITFSDDDSIAGKTAGLYFKDENLKHDEYFIWRDDLDLFEFSNDVKINNQGAENGLTIEAYGNQLGLVVNQNNSDGIAAGFIGEVGINTLSPKGKFHVMQNNKDILVVTQNSVAIGRDNVDTGYALHVSGNLKVDGSILGTLIANSAWEFHGGSNMYNSDKNIGVGTNSPDTRFHILTKSTEDPFRVSNGLNTSTFFNISKTGLVGIGTQNATQKLVVDNGNVLAYGVTASILINTQDKPEIQFGTISNQTESMRFGVTTNYNYLDTNNSDFKLYNTNATGISYKNNGNIGLRKDADDTINLDILGTTKIDGSLDLVNSSALKLGLTANTNQNAELTLDNKLKLQTTTAQGLSLGANSVERLALSSDGIVSINANTLIKSTNGSVIVTGNKVGIGIDEPRELLHISFDHGSDADLSGVFIENSNPATGQVSKLKFGVGAHTGGQSKVEINAIRVNGSTGEANLAILMNETERLRMADNGWLGLNTGDPHAPLEVANVSGTTLFVVTENGVVVKGGVPKQNASNVEYTISNYGTSFFEERVDIGGAPAAAAGPTKLYVNGDVEVTGNLNFIGKLDVTNVTVNQTLESTIIKAVDINYTGNLANTSDERLKKNITPLKSSLEKVLKMEGVEYELKDISKFKDDPGVFIGVIAQQVQKVVPEIVKEQDNGFLSVDYVRLVPLLLESIKSLNEQLRSKIIKIEKIEKENQELRKKLIQIDERLQKLEAKK